MRMNLFLLKTVFANVAFVLLAAHALPVTAQTREDTGTVRSPIVGGTVVTDNDRRNLGLVTLSSGCSGVLLTDRWILTAGHCFGARPFSPFTVSSVDGSATSDLVYEFGGELDQKGATGLRGYDLALVRVDKPLVSAPFKQKEIFNIALPPLGNKNATFYGQGLSTYFQPGPPPVPPTGFGTWRQAILTIQKQISNKRTSPPPDRPGWPDFLVSSPNSAGQVCAPGDSGGPVFFTDSATNIQSLVGIQVSGNFVCPNQSAISIAACKATITKITSCNANMIPGETVQDIIKTSWNANSATQVMDVGAELFNYMFDDPTRETNVDMNLRSWSITARAANEMCFNRGFVSGHMTGHQSNGKFGLVCSTRGAVWKDAITAEIANSGSPFADENTASWAQVRRAASNICANEHRGFVGGHFNGHQLRGFGGLQKAGLICYGTPAIWFDATSDEIAATGWPVGDLNTVGWAQAARAATEFCKSKHFIAGFMTGHQTPGKYGVVCQPQDFTVNESGSVTQSPHL